VIAVDTNILVYAHRADSSWHEAARRRLTELAEGKHAWAIPWPCLHEFIAVVTHPRIYTPPTPTAVALETVVRWCKSPTVVLLGEVDGYLEQLASLLTTGRVAGPMVHDARVAALCLVHGVDALWSADRDFGRFPGLNVVNPLVS
jgi:toxin-antitoxin system PIN domain toxin